MMRAGLKGLFAVGWLVAGAWTAGALTSGALAAEFQGNWVNDASRTLINAVGFSDNEDIARVVVTPEGRDRFRIHLYGRCQGCDWGVARARPYSDAASSDTVRALRADFQTQSGTKHLTLRPGTKTSLRYELVTDFTDRSGRHDYESSGSLRLDAAPPPPEKSPPPAIAAMPARAASASSASPGSPAAAQPLPAEDLEEDCVKFNPRDVIMVQSDRGTAIKEFGRTMFEFGGDKAAAAKTLAALRQYRFDEQCFISRPNARMVYWRAGGKFPRESLPGVECIDIQPDAMAVQGGKVLSAKRVIVDFGGDGASAAKAASVLRNFHIVRQCFPAKPNEKMVYWLAR